MTPPAGLPWSATVGYCIGCNILKHSSDEATFNKGRVSGTQPILAALPLQGCRERNIFGLFRHTSLQNHLFL
jgi:hypothetical protein